MGLLLPGERKSVEPMAARIDPRHVSRAHQSMHHFVANAPSDDEAVLAVARDWALTQLERHAPIGAWVVDDTGIPKKGKHSVGVARQYCGALGKTANCQVAVSVSLANKTMSVPAAWRLYPPETWATDSERRAAAGIPPEVGFLKKWEIALEEIDRLLAEDLPPAPVVADSGYGDTTEFRERLTERGFSYVVGIKADTTAWPPGKEPLPPKPYSGQGCPPTRVRRTEDHRPSRAQDLAGNLPGEAWNRIRWREGTRGAMVSRFATVRVRPAHRDELRTEPRPIEWLLKEWPEDEAEATKYWLSTVPKDVDLPELVSLASETTTAPCAWPPTAFWRPSGAAFPPLRFLPSSSPLRYPTVSAHEAPPVRVLTRLLARAREYPGVDRFPDRSRRAKRRSLDVLNAKGARKRKKAYRDLLRVTEETVGYAEEAVVQLGTVWDPDAVEVAAQLGHYIELAEQVIEQTERRVLHGESVPADEKIVSIFEPHTDIIKKEKRDTHFGHKLTVSAGASGLVLDWVVEDGNPADSTLAVRMIDRHGEIYGRPPRQAAFDGCYASKANLREIKELGVSDVMFSKKRGLKVEDMTRSAWVYRRLRSFRAGVEAWISFLKRCFGLERCTWRGPHGFHRYMGASIVAANLLTLARHLT